MTTSLSRSVQFDQSASRLRLCNRIRTVVVELPQTPEILDKPEPCALNTLVSFKLGSTLDLHHVAHRGGQPLLTSLYCQLNQMKTKQNTTSPRRMRIDRIPAVVEYNVEVMHRWRSTLPDPNRSKTHAQRR